MSFYLFSSGLYHDWNQAVLESGIWTDVFFNNKRMVGEEGYELVEDRVPIHTVGEATHNWPTPNIISIHPPVFIYYLPPTIYLLSKINASVSKEYYEAGAYVNSSGRA